jgi:NAD(P)-dependent dehydrogenase (short-subunit alcohol dehydrogenase family)
MPEQLMNRFRVDGRVAVITGGASGIGLASGAILAEAGARVVLLDRDGDAAQAAAESLGGSVRAMALDVADETAINRVFSDIAESEGRLDILVNSAGMAIRQPAVELALADWDKVVAVNMTGTFLCARAAARVMTAGGSIINIASILGMTGGPYPNISYQTTKGAVVNMTRALALEWAGIGIRVNAVAPTWTRTPFTSWLDEMPERRERIESLTPMGRLAEPEEIAAGIMFLASPASSMVTGHVLAVDGGYLAL